MPRRRSIDALERELYYDFAAVVFPPFRPAALCWAVVLPCLGSPPEPEPFPPLLDALGAFAMRAARCLDIPLSFNASYCLSFLILGRFSGTGTSF